MAWESWPFYLRLGSSRAVKAVKLYHVIHYTYWWVEGIYPNIMCNNAFTNVRIAGSGLRTVGSGLWARGRLLGITIGEKISQIASRPGADWPPGNLPLDSRSYPIYIKYARVVIYIWMKLYHLLSLYNKVFDYCVLYWLNNLFYKIKHLLRLFLFN